MARFNYQLFDEQYNILAKLTGAGSDNMDSSTIVGVVNASDKSIKERLEYAEVSKWASTKLADWDETVRNIQVNLNNLEQLLVAAKGARDAYESWENSQK